MTNEKAKALKNAAELAELGHGMASRTAKLCLELASEEKEEEKKYIGMAAYYKKAGAGLIREAESLARQLRGEDLKGADETQREQFSRLMKYLQIEI